MIEGLPDHREQAMAYYGNDLTSQERVEFEAHLATCSECQALLAKAGRLLPPAEALLAAQVRAQREVPGLVADIERQRSAAPRRRAPWLLALGAAAGIAVVAATVWVIAQQSNPGSVLAPKDPDAGR
jgi:anti-sigma factor RsiW